MVSRIFCHYDFFQIAKFVYLFLCTFDIGIYITTFIFVDRIRRFVVTEYLMNRIEQGQAFCIPTFSDQYNLYIFMKYSHQCFVKTILLRNSPGQCMKPNETNHPVHCSEDNKKHF